MSEQARVVIIGLDGVPYGMLKDFADSGVMPNTARIISDSIFKPMHSSIPEVSSCAWSCMITGANPGEHGTYGFMDLRPGTYDMYFPNFSDLKVRPFWEEWQHKSIIINVPPTYPVRPMNGVHISGFVSIDYDKSVYPGTLVEELKELDYRLDVNSDLAHKNMDLFLHDVDATLAARVSAARYLWDYVDWQTFMLVFTGTDRLMHFLWDAYEDKGHKYRYLFRDHFKKIDKAIGEIVEKLNDNEIVVMLSDHGFERLDYDVFLNYMLIEKGLLQFKQGEEASLKNICPGTKAFVLDPARVYINYKGKYPCGSVHREEGEELLEELEQLFGSLEVEGRKVIRDMHQAAQIYSGPCIGSAPDLVLVGAEGFNLKASVKVKELASKGIFTGKHTQDTAFLVVGGGADGSPVPDVPKVSDVRGIMQKSRSRA
jgi:predicted AlkP superfamily phosphohydrolase/phosphomutase